MSDDCLFCRIVAGEVPATKVHEDDRFLAFEDIHPKAPAHILVIPKRHVRSFATLSEMGEGDRAAMPLFIAEVASKAGLDTSGYRVTTNHGPDSRQSVLHLHWHVLGGVKLSDTM